MKTLIQKINIPEFFEGWKQDQNEGSFTNNEKNCCFGARLAFIFLSCDPKYDSIFNEIDSFLDYYKVGESWFYNQAEKLGFSKSEVNWAFYLAGTGTTCPFNGASWSLPCNQVLQNLQKMEKPPTKEQYISALKQNGHFE